MPYEYRTLNAEEKEEIVQRRREQGFPLHAPPHPFRQSGYYLITASCYEHAAIMLSVERRTEFEKRMLASLREIQAELSGWVILPNHYHFLVGVDSLDIISAALMNLHGTTSREWNQADNCTGHRRVWYKYADRMMRDERQYFRALNYIHINPIKHGYVKDVYEWRWSSLGLYYDDLGRDWLCEKWKSFPINNFGGGWDD